MNHSVLKSASVYSAKLPTIGDIATWDELLPEVATALEFVEGEQS